MSVVWKITHGYDLEDLSDPLAQVVESVNAEFAYVSTPGNTFLVELFPTRKHAPSALLVCAKSSVSTPVQYLPDWMPGTRRWKSFARRARVNLLRSRDEPFDMVKEKVVRVEPDLA